MLARTCFVCGWLVVLAASALAGLGMPDRPCLLACLLGLMPALVATPFFVSDELAKSLDN